MKKNSCITWVVILVAVGMVLTYSSIFSFSRQSNTVPSAVEDSSNSNIQTSLYSYQGEDGKTALQILKEKYSVETENSSFGEMVKSIGGKAADDKNFWAFKVNGQMSPEGAGAYQTKADDQITWELTAI